MGKDKQSKPVRWKKALELMKIYDINVDELADLICRFDLPYYLYNSFEPEDSRDFNLEYLLDDIYKFDLKDMERLKTKYPEFLSERATRPKITENETKLLPSKEARELGQLRTEKKKWNDSIEAAIKATLFCESQDHPVTRDELLDELSRQKLDSIPNTTFDRIWKAIPEEFRNRGGRPKKSS